MERTPPPVAATPPEVPMDAVETPATTGRDPSPAPVAASPPPPLPHLARLGAGASPLPVEAAHQVAEAAREVAGAPVPQPLPQPTVR
jgi:hypothetical protein